MVNIAAEKWYAMRWEGKFDNADDGKVREIVEGLDTKVRNLKFWALFLKELWCRVGLQKSQKPIPKPES